MLTYPLSPSSHYLNIYIYLNIFQPQKFCFFLHMAILDANEYFDLDAQYTEFQNTEFRESIWMARKKVCFRYRMWLF